MDLMSDRQIGMAEGPIPWSAVGRWCDEHGITGDQRADVRYHVAGLDATYLEHQAKKSKASTKVKEGGIAGRSKIGKAGGRSSNVR